MTGFMVTVLLRAAFLLMFFWVPLDVLHMAQIIAGARNYTHMIVLEGAIDAWWLYACTQAGGFSAAWRSLPNLLNR